MISNTLNTTGHFYSSYVDSNPTYNHETFSAAEGVVKSLIEKQTTDERPGMLLGKVQCGKTRTFISAIALAFDNEFDVVVILTKNSTALARQTFERLQQEFKQFIDEDRLDVHDIMTIPSRMSSYELNKKIAIVAKKETRNLDRLTSFFDETASVLKNRRVLIVDDEADYASIGFASRNGSIEVNTIAVKISELRHLLTRSSYLQVTATPYSLYLQPETIDVPNSPDFRPVRPAFTQLVPVPSGYIGGNYYFGSNARSDIPTMESQLHHGVSSKELTTLSKRDGRRLRIEDVLTSNAIEMLRHAIMTFVCGGIIRRLQQQENGESPQKYSFLFHTERAKGAHAWQEEVVGAIVEKASASIISGDGVVESLLEDSYKDLGISIELNGDFLPPLDAVIHEARAAFSDETIINKVNSDEQVAAMLDGSGQLKLRCPYNIFIGGQVLDRGVTLANLIGFYYGRRPQRAQQDTVLQHSRMFGFRPPADMAVTRFYTQNDILQTLFDIEEFDSALRDSIENRNSDVVQFIQRSANGRIVPCSPNKIRLSDVKAIRPFKRILPIGFQTGYKSTIAGIVQKIDEQLARLGIVPDTPSLVDASQAARILKMIEKTLVFDPDDGVSFDWTSADAIVRYLSNLTDDRELKGKTWIILRTGRNSGRLASTGSHAKFIETPDTSSSDGQLARSMAIANPALLLLRQSGDAAKGWRDASFYWPVIFAPSITPVSVYVESAD